MGLIVQKFGGTSVANAERLRNVAQIIADTYRQGNRVVAVLSAQGDTSLTCVGLINETTGGVSDYHTALVYLLETTGEVTVRETEKMSGSWASPQELSAVFDRLETWSQIVLEEVISPNAV